MWKGGTEEDASSDYEATHIHTHPESQVMCSISPAACGPWLSSSKSDQTLYININMTHRKNPKIDWGTQTNKQKYLCNATLNWKWPVKSDEAESDYFLNLHTGLWLWNEQKYREMQTPAIFWVKIFWRAMNVYYSVTIWKIWTCKTLLLCHFLVFSPPCRYCIIENRRIIFF